MPQSDIPDYDQPPGSWVQKYLSLESEVKVFLDDLKRMAVRNDHEQVRKELRKFRNSHLLIFDTLRLSISKHEQFYEDVEDQMGEEIADKLLELAKDYGFLQRELTLQQYERTYNSKNIVTGGSIDYHYLPSEQQQIIQYELESGDVDLVEIHDSVDGILRGAELFTSAAKQGFSDAVESNLPISVDEINAIKKRHGEIESELDELESLLETLNHSEEQDHE